VTDSKITPTGKLPSGRVITFLVLEPVTMRLVYGGGVRLSSLGTSVTIWPIVPGPDDRRWLLWSSRWNENWQGKPKYSEKTCSSATLFTTNPTWSDLGSNPGRRGGKPAINRLSYGTAHDCVGFLSSGRFKHLIYCGTARWLVNNNFDSVFFLLDAVMA
jgi:hypothetical protein